MDIVTVNTKLSSYPIHIQESFAQLPQVFRAGGLEGKKVCIVTDSNVGALYLDEVKAFILTVTKDVSHYVFEAGEERKNLLTVQDMYRFFVEKRLDRQSVIVALGGGVTGDMAGFAAATYMRGVSYVQIPTTLLSQVDSSVGGKVGVDFLEMKNMVGAFYQPRFVYINCATLKTLPPAEFSSGMAEAIKHGFIMDELYYEFITREKTNIKNLVPEAVKKLVYGSCKVKAAVVSEDEREQGLREILNFGHTFGHAVESLSGFKISHGYCVSCGMAAALYVSFLRGNISRVELDRALETLEFFSLPIKVEGLDRDAVYNRMLVDKKNKDNRISLILLNRIGEAFSEGRVSEEIAEGIKFICI